jgi:hypothetical protein
MQKEIEFKVNKGLVCHKNYNKLVLKCPNINFYLQVR